MDEVACLMDWDLEAIVRGYTYTGSGEAPPTATIIGDPPHIPIFSHFFSELQDMDIGDELFASFPEFSETTNVFDELEELYKPFYPVLHPTLSSHSTNIVTSTTSSLTIPKEPEELKASSEKVASQDLQAPSTAVSKYKKSKKRQNKSVVKVTAVEGSVCDAWAWRKYGQKPIKGSIYPRSYYRCSSSKGCLARKQVERSHLDPRVFLVTYTNSEHNHPQPTRRNSLAGTTRKNNNNENSLDIKVPPTTTRDDSSNHSSAVTDHHSPKTPLVAASSNINEFDDEIVMTTSVQQGNKDVEKEEDSLEWLDDLDGAQLCDGCIPSKELEEFIINY